ncbi:MAG: UDP-N-acetylmuramate--L-alanine ligase [Chlamydiales bacterium]|nr:UDP-N-acetylmuramate--L-alanine ligase [Chlamydiales bacterium]
MKEMQYHFIGIGGIGMSALAHILLQKSMNVSGSDIQESKKVDDLRKKGATIYIGHMAEHVKATDIVIYSSAVKHDNPELVRAKQLGCTLWHRADLLRWLARNQHALVVVGAHGKTTTTSLLAHVLYIAGKNPSYVFGGHSPSFITNGHAGSGEYFVLEGDESDGSLLKTDPVGAIVTNIDSDHLDFWQSKQALCHAYVSFMLKVKEKDLLLWCADDPFLSIIKPRGVSYGFSKDAHVKIKQAKYIDNRSKFDLEFDGKTFTQIDLSIVGDHNVLNATAVFALAMRLNIPEIDIRLSFSSYKGVHRRLEKKGQYLGADIYDDYAHHPTEIEATIKALKHLSKDKRVCAIFQPHRYSRMKTIVHEFADAFKDVDHLIVTDIYSAGESPIPGIDTNLVMKTIKPKQNQLIEYIARRDLNDHLKEFIRSNNVVITLGAGDICEVSEALASF